MAGNQGNYRENPTRNEKKYKKANGQPRLKEKSSRAKSDNVCPYAKKCGGCDYQGVEYKEQLKNKQAAKHLMDEIDNVYNRLEENPLQFPPSRDTYLANKGYHEAVIGQMNYTIVFSIRADIVNILGIFHQLENYPKKL